MTQPPNDYPETNIGSLLDIPYELGRGDPNIGYPGSGKAGPRGIEAVIEYNGLFMNVRDWIDTYLVTTIGGIDDADVRDNREVNPGYHGETAFIGLYGGRTITLTGKIICQTIFKLRDMQQGLRQAFSRLDRELPLIFRAPSPELDMMIYCRKSQSIQMADEQRTANHFERAFMIMLRASNPRFVSSIRNYSETAFPGTTFDAIATTLVNDGNFTSQPEIEVTGPATNLYIVNEANGHMIHLTAPVPANERWIMDTAARRMYRFSDQGNRFQYLDVNSDWMELQPGINNIRVTASGLTSASRLIFRYRHTWM